jgi:hypothetical protein
MVTSCGGGPDDVVCYDLKRVDQDGLIKVKADKQLSPEECTELCDDPTDTDGDWKTALSCKAVADEADQLRCGYNCDDCTCGRRLVGLRSQGAPEGLVTRARDRGRRRSR